MEAVPLTIATWNINGVRARQADLHAFIDRERPDILCLQELKAAPEQVPQSLAGLDDYWSCWHGGKGYSGVGLLVRKSRFPDAPTWAHPDFDFEHRIVTARLPEFTVASVYVPNGGKDYEAKLRFVTALDGLAAHHAAEGLPLVLGGDLNITRTDLDVHPKERKPKAIGQLPEERALFAQLLGRDLVDLQRHLHPDASDLFTWWAPWRDMRARNIGWRIDYLLASAELSGRVAACTVQRDTGSSDHGPLIALFD